MYTSGHLRTYLYTSQLPILSKISTSLNKSKRNPLIFHVKVSSKGFKPFHMFEKTSQNSIPYFEITGSLSLRMTCVQMGNPADQFKNPSQAKILKLNHMSP